MYHEPGMRNSCAFAEKLVYIETPQPLYPQPPHAEEQKTVAQESRYAFPAFLSFLIGRDRLFAR